MAVQLSLPMSLGLTPKQREQLEGLVKQLERSYERHEHILHHGTTDPLYHDGINLHLVRNHILYFRGEIARLCAETMTPFPPIMHRPVPPEYPMDWCRRCLEGRCTARLHLGTGDRKVRKCG